MEDHTTLYGLHEIRAISFFSTSLQKKKSVDAVLWGITKNVVHQLGFVDCVIYEFDTENNLLMQRAAYGRKNPSDTVIYNKIAIPVGQGISGHVAKYKKAQLVKDTSLDNRYIVDDESRLSEICVPIIINDRLFGVIDSEHPRKNFYTEKHLHLLTIIAALCAQKLKELGNPFKKSFSKDNAYFKKLQYLMRTEKIYRNPDLSLGAASELLGISSCYLSSMVNALLKKSFIDYINEYRVADVQKNLHKKEYEQYTIVSIGLEAGFNSKSAFYNAFKKNTGSTPSQFKKVIA